MTDDLFEVLRRAMKARRMTYAELAARLGVSEPTVKRLFAERDCKLTRLRAICAALDLSLPDLIAAAQEAEQPPTDLTDAQETALATDMTLVRAYLLLRDGVAPEEEDGFLALRRLERLGLARLDQAGGPRALPEQPIRFRPDGALMRALRRVNLDFAAAAYDAAPRRRDEAFFRSISRRARPETLRAATAEIDATVRAFAARARRDQLTSPAAELQNLKLSVFAGRVDFASLLREGG